MSDKLNTFAQLLADAQAAEKAAKEALAKLQAEFDEREDVAALKQKLKSAKTAKTTNEKDAKAEIERLYKDGESLETKYFDVQKTVTHDYDGGEMVRWLIDYAPALAAGLLTVNDRALSKFVAANAVRSDEDAHWPEYLAPVMLPVKLGVAPKPRILWSKLPKPSEELRIGDDVEGEALFYLTHPEFDVKKGDVLYVNYEMLVSTDVTVNQKGKLKRGDTLQVIDVAFHDVYARSDVILENKKVKVKVSGMLAQRMKDEQAIK